MGLCCSWEGGMAPGMAAEARRQADGGRAFQVFIRMTWRQPGSRMAVITTRADATLRELKVGFVADARRNRVADGLVPLSGLAPMLTRPTPTPKQEAIYDRDPTIVATGRLFRYFVRLALISSAPAASASPFLSLNDLEAEGRTLAELGIGPQANLAAEMGERVGKQVFEGQPTLLGARPFAAEIVLCIPPIEGSGEKGADKGSARLPVLMTYVQDVRELATAPRHFLAQVRFAGGWERGKGMGRMMRINCMPPHLLSPFPLSLTIRCQPPPAGDRVRGSLLQAVLCGASSEQRTGRAPCGWTCGDPPAPQSSTGATCCWTGAWMRRRTVGSSGGRGWWRGWMQWGPPTTRSPRGGASCPPATNCGLWGPATVRGKGRRLKQIESAPGIFVLPFPPQISTSSTHLLQSTAAAPS